MTEYNILKDGNEFANGISQYTDLTEVFEQWLDANGFEGLYDEFKDVKNGVSTEIEGSVYTIVI